ncbi:MAG TPA: hypothetical protein VGH97_07505 [Thermoanaerobaculia bacterium]|jgi:3-mercaptopyruvate sulfurtransferase SseA
MLIDRGFKMVRPLAGGIDGWEQAGYQVESQPLIPITPPLTGTFKRPS